MSSLKPASRAPFRPPRDARRVYSYTGKRKTKSLVGICEEDKRKDRGEEKTIIKNSLVERREGGGVRRKAGGRVSREGEGGFEAGEGCVPPQVMQDSNPVSAANEWMRARQG